MYVRAYRKQRKLPSSRSDFEQLPRCRSRPPPAPRADRPAALAGRVPAIPSRLLIPPTVPVTLPLALVLEQLARTFALPCRSREQRGLVAPRSAIPVAVPARAAVARRRGEGATAAGRRRAVAKVRRGRRAVAMIRRGTRAVAVTRRRGGGASVASTRVAFVVPPSLRRLSTRPLRIRISVSLLYTRAGRT